MTFEEVDMDLRTTPIQTPSYTSLIDYCTSNYWQEEDVRFSKKRKITLGECGESSYLVENETAVDIVIDSWVENESSFDEELEDLQDAYQVMSKMAAEYGLMERAASKFTSTLGNHQGTLPMQRPTCDANRNSQMQRNMSLLPQVHRNIVPIIYKENTAMCRDWLMGHYEAKEGVSIPRSAMYSHYLDFCGEGYNDPLNPAGFGKAVRSVFTSVQTRRLGNRGASKYHYYGLSIKDSSPYKTMLQGTQRVNNMLDVDPPSHQLSAFYPRTLSHNSDGLGAKVVLEGFPSVSCVVVSQELKLQLKVFLSMYKTHCEDILDTVLQTSFPDIKDSFLHFWMNLPEHLLILMSHDSIVNIVHLCDVALYKTIGGMLLPSIIQSQPQNLLSSIRNLTDNLIEWTEIAVSKLPESLKSAKLTAVKDFKQQLKRQSMLNHITQCVKTTLRDHDIVKKMLSDWLGLDQVQITKEILKNMGEEEDARSQYHVRKYMRDFERHLSHRVSLEKYLSFISNILHNCTSNMMVQSDMELEEAVSMFMLHWTSAVNTILREFTINAVQTFGSFHLLSMLFTDYLMYLIEERKRALAEVKLKDLVYRGNKPAVAATQKVTGKIPEYKPIAPKNSLSTISSRVATDYNHLSDMGNAKLSNIMNQLSSMNHVKKIENQHLYLATPVKLDQSDNSNVAMKNIISQITNKILLESRIVKPSNTITKQSYFIKTEDNFVKREFCRNKDQVPSNVSTGQVDLNNVKSETDSHNQNDTGEINKQFLLFCPKLGSKNNNGESDSISKGLHNGKHPGYVIKKKENIKIVSLNSLKQPTNKDSSAGKAISEELHIVTGNHLLESNHALKKLKNSLNSSSSSLLSKKQSIDRISKPKEGSIFGNKYRNDNFCKSTSVYSARDYQCKNEKVLNLSIENPCTLPNEFEYLKTELKNRF